MAKLTTEVWSKEKNVRAIRVFKSGFQIDLVRIYAEEPMGNFNPTKFVSLQMTSRALFNCYGSERWSNGLTMEQAKEIVNRFRKSAEHDGFKLLGQYEGV